MEHILAPMGRSAKQQARAAALELKNRLFQEVDQNLDLWMDQAKPERRRRSSTPPAITMPSMPSMPSIRAPPETEEAMRKKGRNASPPARIALENKAGEGESQRSEGSWMRKSKAELLHQLDLRPGYHHIMGKFSAEKQQSFLQNMDKRQLAQILLRLDGVA